MTYLPGDRFDPYDGAAEHGLEALEVWYQTLRDLCDFDPTVYGREIPIGHFHCPQCGCMVMAGFRHPKCDPQECGLASADGPVDLGDPGTGRMVDLQPDHPDEPLAPS